MIFYFSATGNSKYVAQRIAKAIDDRIISISECLKKGEGKFRLTKDERLGIIVPTYCWGLPIIVREFLEELQLEVESKPYCFFVTTYGTLTGKSDARANEYMKLKNLSFDGFYSVKMPDTFTPMFDLSDQEKLNRIHRNGEKEIDGIIQHIQDNDCGNYMRHRIPDFASKIYYRTYENIRKTSHFKLEDRCIGCRICEKNCPVRAIEMLDNKPIWVKEKCVMCLACLHRCPKFAIQYGNKTQKHGQYVNPNSIRM